MPCGGVDRFCGSEWEQELVVNCGPEGSWTLTWEFEKLP